jgi:hypothetical protein
MHLDEHLRRELGEPRLEAAHAPGGVVLRDAVGGGDEREHLVVAVLPRGGVVRVVLVRVALADRVGLVAAPEQVAHGGLVGLVVPGQRPVGQAGVPAPYAGVRDL